jgi:hypothetical protein
MRAIALLLLLGCAASVGAQEEDQPPPKESRERRMMVSCEEESFLNGAVTFEELARRVQERYIVRQDVATAEGMTEPGAVLFPAVPQRRLEIIWREREVLVTLRDKNSFWKTTEGVGVGNTLKQLERLNGRSFTMTGFGWDYAGTVTSWRNGKLQGPKDESCRVVVRLDYSREGPAAAANEKLGEQVQGDGEFSSRLPALQKLNPRVYEVVVSWQRPGAPAEEVPPETPTEQPPPPKDPPN